MFKILRNALALALALTLLAPVASARLLGTPVAEAQKTDLFRFFHLSVDGKKAVPQGQILTFRTSPKSPFRPLMRVEVTIDSKSVVTAATLHIDRAFVDSPRNGVFARDLAKSFLKAALPASDQKTRGALVAAIARAGRAVEREEDAAAYAVFLGKSGRYQAALSAGRLVLANGAVTAGKQWLSLSVDAASATASATPDTFLTAADLAGMRRSQDSRSKGADARDKAFSKHGGQSAGMAVWMGGTKDAVWRLVDIRWTFPTEAAARAYHADALKANSEGAAPVPAAGKVGSECSVFGGTSTHPALGVTMTQFYYVFRVGKVVAKVYVAQGPSAAKGALTAAKVQAIAAKAAARMSP